FTRKQWQDIVIGEIARILKPGGWVEFVEPDATNKSQGPYTKKIFSACLHAFFITCFVLFHFISLMIKVITVYTISKRNASKSWHRPRVERSPSKLPRGNWSFYQSPC